jgi:cytochrome P450
MEFDGFRFSNIRAMEGKENKHQLATSSADSLSWGYGSHACPGRFFASNEIKVIMIELLRNWEFRLKGDITMEGGVEIRPKDNQTPIGVHPNLEAEIEFKRRKV